MLHNSFLQIPAVGSLTEMKIWDHGVHSIEDFIKSPPSFLSPKKQIKMLSEIKLSKESLNDNEPLYYYENLNSKDHWRIFKEFRHSSVFLDIETTGLDPDYCTITTISLYDGKNIKYYINGKNLDDFKIDIMNYNVIITYNGKCFDVPFIEKYFKISIPHAQLDLRYILASLGYSGGLKSCEKQLGIGRTGPLSEVDGFFAVILWKDYKKNNNIKSLETLLSYNIEDVLNLEFLMIKAYNQNLSSIPFSIPEIAMNKLPTNPFKIDAETVNRLNSVYL